MDVMESRSVASQAADLVRVLEIWSQTVAGVDVGCAEYVGYHPVLNATHIFARTATSNHPQHPR